MNSATVTLLMLSIATAAAAQTQLGLAYSSGHGVPQDYAQAAEWYRKSAEQGNTYGQVAIGSAYAIGRGVAKDDARGEEWIRKAAAQGYDPARDALKRLGKGPWRRGPLEIEVMSHLHI